MNADQLLNDLGLTMNLPNLRFNESGCARLEFDGKTTVNLEIDAQSGRLQLYSDVCGLPPDGREALYLSLLEANLFGAQTMGATLAVDSLFHAVVMCRTLVTDDLSGAGFAQIIGDFVNSVEQWRETLTAGNHTSVSASVSSADLQVFSVGPFDGFIRG
jgi:hypothetical protein